jgi:hypothetical protein
MNAAERAFYANPAMEKRRRDMIAMLGDRWMGHGRHAPPKGDYTQLPPEKQAELKGWICAAEHLEQTADAIGGNAGDAFRASATRLRVRARDLFAHGIGGTHAQ